MNNFGLGLILNFTDNATSGIQRAAGAFNDLEGAIEGVVTASSKDQALLQFSYAAGIVGNELYGVGKKITSVFMSAINSINDTGTTIMTARSQLGTLYGSVEAGYEVLDKIKDYSAKSIFNFEDLIPSVIMLKSNGIEAFDEIATSAYRASNGVEGVSQTLMDYAADLAAFNPQMHNMYGTGVQAAMGALNEYIAEGNARSLKTGASLDILQILGEDKGKTIEERSRQVADLIEKLGMVGMTANLAGTPMQRLANVEDLVFNTMSQIADSGVYDKFSALIEKFTNYLFSIPEEEIAQIAQIIADALVEIMDPLEYLVDLLISIVDKVRILVKENPELVKALTKGIAFAGVIALISGGVLKLLSTLGMLKFSLGKLFGGSLLSSGLKLVSILKSLLLYLGPIAAAVILLKSAWDRNFMGMQDTTKKFVRDTIDTFKILFDAWSDYSLSEDNFERAKELGILPFIEAVLQLKYHLGFLVKGIKAGFDAFFDGIAKALTKMGILDKETHGFRDLITSLLEKITAPGMTDNWEKLGYYIGKIGGYVLLIVAVLPVVLKIVKAVFAIVGAVKALITFLPTLISIIKGIGTAISVVVGIITTPIVAIPLAIAAIIFGIYELIKHWDNVCEAIKRDFLIKLEIIKAVIAKLKTLPIIGDIVRNIEEKFKFVLNIVIKSVEVIKKVLSAVYNFVKPIVSAIASAFTKIFGKLINLFLTVRQKVGEVLQHVWGALSNIIYAVYEIIRVVKLAVQVVFKWVYEHIIEPIVNAISTAFSWVHDHVIAPVMDRISERLNFIKEIVKTVFTFIRDFVTRTIQKISDVVSPIIDGISNAISFLADKLNAAVDAVKNFFGGVGDFFKGVGDNLEEMLGLSTGGYVKETGAAVLHPNEVVLNDILTQRLGNFLEEYDYAKTHQPVNVLPATTPQTTEVGSPIQNYVTNSNSSVQQNSGDTEVDNSVVFNEGSIVFNVDKDTDLANMSESELASIAEKLMRIMARKAQLRTMQTRK